MIAIAAIVWAGGRDVIQHIPALSVILDFSRQKLVPFHWVRNVATIGVLVAFTQYSLRFFRPIQDLSDKYNILQSAMASSERIFKLLDTPVDIESPAVTKKPEGPGRIEFDHVWFSYGVRGTAADTLGKPVVAPIPAGDDSSSGIQRPRLGASRCVIRDRTRRDHRHRGAHRRRKNDAYLAPAAFLRCAKRCDPHRWGRHQGDGSERFAPPLRRRAAGSVPVHRDGGRQYPARIGLDRRQGCRRGRRRSEPRRLHPNAPGRLWRGSAGTGIHPFYRAEAVDLLCACSGPQSRKS